MFDRSVTLVKPGLMEGCKRHLGFFILQANLAIKFQLFRVSRIL